MSAKPTEGEVLPTLPLPPPVLRTTSPTGGGFGFLTRPPRREPALHLTARRSQGCSLQEM
ncbi:MAG: hypothetical protein DI526_22905 [Caulobacter segnis]|uniref:Uncharacterized protein n=1 Tax=Caulobacter segnis TaxID=88688 RepID=A0A2W5V4K1_9CAUL|nr:MAG: hypothetical protein DI526_22905 [Caulobacter segnis]